MNTQTDYQQLLERLALETKAFSKLGKPADYIPALANVSPEQFAISLITRDGNEFATGNHTIPFSIQSISKVFTFTLVYRKIGTAIWDRIGREPS